MMVPVMGAGEEGLVSWVEISTESAAEGEQPDGAQNDSQRPRYGEPKLVWRTRAASKLVASVISMALPG
jgi:hypothetical protein